MSPYCPFCETDLDPATGICPACRWQHATILPEPDPQPEPEQRMTLTERYRGTEWDSAYATTTFQSHHGSVSRGRLFVFVGLFAVGGIYATAMALMGMLP